MAMRRLGRAGPDEPDKLEAWLEAGYTKAYRTAYLILRNHHDAEEAVQEAFLRAWRFRAAVPDGDGMQPWMYRVVVNCCLSRLRADRNRSQRWDALESDPEAAELGPEGVFDVAEARQQIISAVSSLPPELRVVVVLRYYAQLSEKDIAAVIRRRPGTVKSRVHQAKARLARDPSLAWLRPGSVAVGQEVNGD